MSLKMEHTSPPNPIGFRLKHEMRKRGLTSTELARRAEVKTSFIYDVISGKSANPSTVKLARVADSLGVSLAYLAGYEPANNNSRSAIALENDEYATILPLTIDGGDKNPDSSLPRQEREPYRFHRNWISSHLHSDTSVLRMALVKGDSMEPTLCHNDIMLVDISSRTPSPPGIFMLHDGFGLVAKRLDTLSDRDPQQIRVISDNSKYASYECLLEDIRIVGRVVWFSREI